MKIAGVGDLICTRPVLNAMSASDPDLLNTLRETDLTIGNMEFVVPGINAVPAPYHQGIHLAAEAGSVGDLKEAGFDLVSVANNHATDFGPQGLESSMKFLSQAGLPYAGAGRDLHTARAPTYIEGEDVRTAVIGCTTTHSSYALAADSGRGFSSERPHPRRSTRRPPITALRLETAKNIPTASPSCRSDMPRSALS